jgi:sulfite exporter TauE/SafE
MSQLLVLLGGLAVGFLGSAHCVGMCGGIAGALSMAVPADCRRPLALARRQALYSLGRVLSYALAGMLAGGFGFALAAALGPQGGLVLRGVAAGLLVLLGAYLAGWSNGLVALERLGARLWRRIGPCAVRLRPGHSALGALVVGMLWGWLPCGLVYSALALAAASGGAGHGALLMVGFGLGTLPAVLTSGLLAHRVAVLSRASASRRAAGVLLLLFGLWTFAAGSAPLLGGAAQPCHPAAGAQP